MIAQVTPNPKVIKPMTSYGTIKVPSRDRYVLVSFPEIQEFMNNPRWGECILCTSIEGHECPDSTYAVPEDLYDYYFKINLN